MSNDLPQKPFKGEVKAVSRWRVAASKYLNKTLHVYKRIPRQIRFLLLVVLILLIAIPSWIAYRDHQRDAKAVKSICSTAPGGVLEKAAPLLNKVSKNADLKKIVDSIQATPNYSRDPNCMYPIVSYYINTGDYDNAKTNLDKLVVVYDPQKGFSSALGTYTKNISTLKADVNYLNTFNQELKKNSEMLKVPKT